MEDSSVPAKFALVWAVDALAAYITTPIPTATQTGVNAARASLQIGFPPVTFVDPAAGGTWPDGRDFQGALNMLSASCQWQQAGAPWPYDAAFQTAIGGYANNAVVASALFAPLSWLSTIDDNDTNPDTGGADWRSFLGGLTWAHGQCYFQYVNAGEVRLVPLNGNNIVSGKIQYQIGNAGISAGTTNVWYNGVAGQDLPSNGTFYVSFNGPLGVLRYWSSGSYGHAPDTTFGNIGIEVITANTVPMTDDTLVGFASTSGGLFQSQGVGVSSWFNPVDVSLVGNATVDAVSESTGSFVDAGSSYHVPFFSWARHAPSIVVAGGGYNSTSNGGANFAVGIDGIVVGQGQGWSASLVTGTPNLTSNGVAGTTAVAISEALHFATPMVQRGSGGGTATFNVAAYVTVKA